MDFPSQPGLTAGSRQPEDGRIVAGSLMRGTAMRRLWRILCGAVISFSLITPVTAPAIGQEPAVEVVVPESECKVKYVYLYSFGLLVKWPESTYAQTGNEFVIGVLGTKPFGAILDAIAQRKQVNGCRIRIRRFRSMDEYQPCHILFITDAVTEEAAKDAAGMLRDKPVLIVGEIDRFEQSGGVIVFHIEDGNVKFSLNIDAARRRQLVVGARLSRLARVVHDENRVGVK